MGINLSDREKKILENIIHNYILTANPVGSRVLSRKSDLGLSPATIRNVMIELEEMGMIEQPHTSAGRVPTDTGYRWYVDNLMKIEKLSPKIKRKIKKQVVESGSTNIENLLHQTSFVLSKVSSQLAVVLSPEISTGILKKIEVLKISERQILVVISIISGPVRTITLELKSGVERSELEMVNTILNERLSGLKLDEIKSTIVERMKDVSFSDDPLIRIFIDSADELFDTSQNQSYHIEGVIDLANQPEFSGSNDMKTIIELLEEKKMIVHLFREGMLEKGIKIKIGGENRPEKIRQFSVITSAYQYGDVTGTLGIIGPTRMHYPRVVTLVDYTSKLLSKILTD